jgi:hypothetical protein
VKACYAAVDVMIWKQEHDAMEDESELVEISFRPGTKDGGRN